MAAVARAVSRASHRAAKGGDRADRLAGHALESDASGHRGGAVARSVRAVEGRRRAAAVIGRRHRVRTGDAAVAMDRVAASSRPSGSRTSISVASSGSIAKIRSIITLTKDHALARAKAADAEIAAGKYRGPLHGIPYGVKDLLDTKDIPTTYGAEPFRNRVPVGGLRGRAQAERRRRGARSPSSRSARSRSTTSGSAARR